MGNVQAAVITQIIVYCNVYCLGLQPCLSNPLEIFPFTSHRDHVFFHLPSPVEQ